MGMKLPQLIDAINLALKYERHPENIDVVIDISLPYITCGARPYEEVSSANMGFDWEAGQFRITPKETLMCVKDDTPQLVREWGGAYHCPKCEKTLSKKKDVGIRYCSKCGLAVKWNE